MAFSIQRLPRLPLHGVLAGIAVAVALAALAGPTVLPDLFTEAASRHQAVEDSCRQNMGCWSEENLVAAQKACIPLIEAKAANGFKWTGGWLDSVFFNSHALSSDNFVLEYAGDAVLFRDAMGAWKPKSYYCSFDTRTGRITALRIVAGDNPDN
ncbi:MAG TPA: hypothetical protein VHC00_06005 [Rhizobiaceae bacterium]|nr:hypothetical protein [Rhizobiaceae bacterium]